MLRFKDKIIAVDFDGTCVIHEFPNVGEDVPYSVTTLKRLASEGAKLILYTMRSNNKMCVLKNMPDTDKMVKVAVGNFLDDAVEWFQKHDIPLFGINQNPEQKTWTSSPKPYAHIYIDDSALGCPLTGSNGNVYVDWLRVWEILSAPVRARVGNI